MPRAHSDSGRIELRLRPEDKAVLTRAATLERLDLTGFILRNVLPQAAALIARIGMPAMARYRCSTRRFLSCCRSPWSPMRSSAGIEDGVQFSA
jgi:uncharacterized protein (DUF1778 family)